MQAWEEKAIEREEGRKEQQQVSARKLLKKGMEIEEITEVTGLSEEEIKRLDL